MQTLNQQLKPGLSEKFNSIIWKIEIDEGQELIAIETRDKNAHSAAFSSFNYVTGKCYLKEQNTENSWWWGLDRAYNGLLYLHGYKSESSPEHSGIIAWDAKTGKIKWQRFNYALDNISDQGLIVYNPSIQSAKPELISPETGTIKEIIAENALIQRHILFPEAYNNLLPLPDFIPSNAVEPFLYLDYHGKKCWSFHVKTEDGFTQKLIIAENDEIILSDNLATGIQKLNPEAFFMQKSYLFCIRNNNYEITSYLLS
ncbi:MAG TPA: hypothetical protein DIT07_08255 [Sphingobacteriaceae bacterium]|nr:hypothetical protein [Sphingobacteriaceae bacterium]